MKILKPAAVILDFDGVVVDSLEAHLKAWQLATSEVFRCALPTPEEFSRLATRTIAHIIAKRLGDRSLARPLVKAKWRHLEASLEPAPLFTGVRDFIEDLQTRQLPFGIASNSPRAFVVSTLQRHGLTVPVVVGGDEVSRAKPNPDIFWECSQRLGLTRSFRPRTFVFEDSLHGIKGAIDAGMVAVGVASAHPEGELTKAGASVTCKHLGDALAGGVLEGGFQRSASAEA